MESLSISTNQENGIKVTRLQDLGRQRLLHDLHTHLPKNPVDLYNALLQYQVLFKTHLRKKILNHYQYNILFPSSGQTYSKDFDIILIFYLLRTCCIRNAPETGWKKEPNPTDNSKEANYIRLNHVMHHKGSMEMTNHDFEVYKTKFSRLLVSLGCENKDIANALTLQMQHVKENTTPGHEKARVGDNEKMKVEPDEKETKDERDHTDKLTSSVTYKMLPTCSTFIGRDEEMDSLHKMLVNPTGDQLGVVICGMAGVGKTELARAYANEKKNHYDNNVLWMNGESESSMEQSFLEIAQFIGLSIKEKLQDGVSEEFLINKVIQQKVYRFFENHKCLFIFDNVKDNEIINHFLPLCNNGNMKPSILITSQSLHWGSYFNVLSIGVFSQDFACDFLKNNEKFQSDQTEREKLCELLGYHPFALQQAISYVNVNACSYSHYASLLERAPQQFTNTSPARNTFQMSLKKIREISSNDRILCQMIEFIPFLDGKNIKKNFFMQLFNQDELEADRALLTLQSFSLITIIKSDNVNEDNIITVHSLVQKALLLERKRENNIVNSLHHLLILISEIDQPSNCRRHSSKHLANIFNNTFIKQDVIQVLKDMPERNVYKLLDILYDNGYWKELISITQDLLQQSLFERLNLKLNRYVALSYLQQGDYKEALESLKKVEATEKSFYGEYHRDVLETQNSIALCYVNMGYYQKALEIYQNIESEEIKMYGILHPELLTTQHNIASCYLNMGNHQKALYIYQGIESNGIYLYGKEHPDVLTIQQNIASCYVNMGKYHKALEIYRDVESKEIHNFGENHPELLTTQSNIASCYVNMGDYEVALSIYRNVESKEIYLFGADHPQLLQTQHDIASCYVHSGEIQKALDIYQNVESKQINLYEENHPRLLMTQHNLALCYVNMGNYQKALDIYLSIESKELIMYQEDHPKLLMTQRSIASCYVNMGCYQKALNIYQNVELKEINLYGEHHPDLLTIQQGIALCYVNMGSYQKALHLYQQVETKAMKLLGESHPELLTTQHNIASCYDNMGGHQKALDIYQIVESKEINLYGEHHPNLLSTQHSIASCYVDMGYYQKALDIYQSIESKEIQMYGEQHPERLMTQHGIAVCYVKMGNYEKALNIYRNVESKEVSIYGEGYPKLLTTQHGIASCYVHIGEFQEALDIYRNIELKEVSIYGEDHPKLLTTQHGIASCYVHIGEFQEALDIYRNIELKEVSIYGEDHPKLLTTQHGIASCYVHIGEFKEALDIYQNIKTKEISLYENDHPKLLTTQHNIALCQKVLDIYQNTESKEINFSAKDQIVKRKLLSIKHGEDMKYQDTNFRASSIRKEYVVKLIFS